MHLLILSKALNISASKVLGHLIYKYMFCIYDANLLKVEEYVYFQSEFYPSK